MKHIFMVATIFFISSFQLSATNCLQSLSSAVSDFGKSIENIDNVPVVGKLVNILPIEMLAAGFKQCPLQTIAVLAAWGTYMISRNEKVRNIMGNNVSWAKRNIDDEQNIDENIFFFDGDQKEAINDLSGNELLGNEADRSKQLNAESAFQSFL